MQPKKSGPKRSKRKVTPRKLTLKDVEIVVSIEPDDIPIEGNAIASGDDAVDREVNEGIRKQLDNGNQWAWCVVKVSALFEGFEGTDYLGGCSYESEAAFRKDGGYFNDMVERAIDDLNAEIAKTAARIPVHKSTEEE